MKKRKQKSNTRKVGVDGQVRRAYGLFKQRVVHNVPWSITALDNILSGDHKALSAALKFHDNLQIEETFTLVTDPEPVIGDTVETLVETVSTVVMQQDPPPQNNEEDETAGALFTLGSTSKPQEWKSSRFQWPLPKRVQPVIQRQAVASWEKADVTRVSRDGMHMDLCSHHQGRMIRHVHRTRIRVNEDMRALLGEPHFRLGENAVEIPVAKYFKSVRLNDEGVDGGGVYGRHLPLPRYDKNKLTATIGDTLLHLVCKNEHLPKRQEILAILMSLGSFDEESLKVRNASNRTALEELEPPYSLRIPLAGYSFGLNVRLRETRLAVERHLFDKQKPEVPPADTLLWLVDPLKPAAAPTGIPKKTKKKVTSSLSSSSSSLLLSSSSSSPSSIPSVASAASSTSSGSAPSSVIMIAGNRHHGKRTSEGKAAKPGDRVVVRNSERETGIRIPFVDGGSYRGVIVAHRWVFPRTPRKKAANPFFARRQKPKEPSSMSVEDETMQRLQFCIEWQIPRSQINSQSNKEKEATEEPRSLANFALLAKKERIEQPSAAQTMGRNKHQERKQERLFYQNQINNASELIPLRRKWYAGTLFFRSHVLAVRRYLAAALDPLGETQGIFLDNDGRVTTTITKNVEQGTSSLETTDKVEASSNIGKRDPSHHSSGSVAPLKSAQERRNPGRMAVGPVSLANKRLFEERRVLPPPTPLQYESVPRYEYSGNADEFTRRVLIEAQSAADEDAKTRALSSDPALLRQMQSLESLLLPGGQARLEAQQLYGDGILVSGVTPLKNVLEGDVSGCVLRAREERNFLGEWLYEVFTPESLVGADGGAHRASSRAARKMARKWFKHELKLLANKAPGKNHHQALG